MQRVARQWYLAPGSCNGPLCASLSRHCLKRCAQTTLTLLIFSTPPYAASVIQEKGVLVAKSTALYAMTPHKGLHPAVIRMCLYCRVRARHAESTTLLHTLPNRFTGCAAVISAYVPGWSTYVVCCPKPQLACSSISPRQDLAIWQDESRVLPARHQSSRRIFTQAGRF